MAIEIKQHPRTQPWGDLPHQAGELWLAIVTTSRGRCYSIPYAGDRPTEATVRQAWREDRKAFDPYRAC